MRTLRFYGASDDLFEIDGTGKGEPYEIGCYDNPVTVCVADKAKSIGLFVTAHYAVAGCGCWMIGITPLDEDLPLPPWPMRWTAAGYSTVLEIDVPDGISVSEPTK